MIASYGWPSVFYVFGAAGLLWFLLWQQQAASSPAQDPNITPAEARYIMRNTASSSSSAASSGAHSAHGGGLPGGRAAAIPWRQLLSKAPVWALIVSHFCHNWGTFILLTYMPSYYTQAR